MAEYTKKEIKEIKCLLRTAGNPVMYRKYLTISLHMKGFTNKQIAEMLDLDQHTVGSYVRIYKSQGVDGLIPQKPSGRPKFLTKEQEELVYDTISNKTPENVGFDGVKNWTARLACLWVLETFGIQYKVNGMLKLFHRINLSYTRPTYVLAKADPEKQEQFREEFEKVKRALLNGEIDHIVIEDESSIRDYQAIMKSWFPKGQQKLIRTYGKHESVKLIGIINYETGHVYVEESEEFNAQIFLNFLKNILELYPEGRIVMVLDNSKVHHAKLLNDFLEANPRLKLMFLPPYSPKMNIIEGLWGWLKDTCINNVFFDKFYKVRLAIRKFVALVNSDLAQTIDRLCVQM